MKKIFGLIFLTSLFAINTNAQIRRTSDSTQSLVSNSAKRTEKLETINGLNLTKQQMSQLKEARRNIKQHKDAINNDQSLSDEQKENKLKDLRKEQKEKLNSILTPEQMEKLREERMKTRMRRSKTNQSDSASSILDN
jgi:hypothetical protein